MESAAIRLRATAPDSQLDAEDGMIGETVIGNDGSGHGKWPSAGAL